MNNNINLAVLIDGDNIPSAHVKAMMEEIAKYGNPTIKRIYGDWTKPCLVSSDSDFTRLATRLREAGMQVIGIGEKKTPNPFIVACDKFIYIEILKNQVEKKNDDSKEPEKTEVDKITRKEIKLISTTIMDLSDEDGWAFLGDVGSLLQKKQPNFDSRNYGFEKLTPLIKSIGNFELEQRESPKSKHKLIFVRNKKKNTIKPKKR